MQETDQGTLQVKGDVWETGLLVQLTRIIYLCPPLRRRRAMAPPISRAVPNNSAVTGSGTGAGPGSPGGGGGLKAWSGSCLGQPQLNSAAARERPRIHFFGRILSIRMAADQPRSELETRFVFLMGIPSFYLSATNQKPS